MNTWDFFLVSNYICVPAMNQIDSCDSLMSAWKVIKRPAWMFYGLNMINADRTLISRAEFMIINNLRFPLADSSKEGSILDLVSEETRSCFTKLWPFIMTGTDSEDIDAAILNAIKAQMDRVIDEVDEIFCTESIEFCVMATVNSGLKNIHSSHLIESMIDALKKDDRIDRRAISNDELEENASMIVRQVFTDDVVNGFIRNYDQHVQTLWGDVDCFVVTGETVYIKSDKCRDYGVLEDEGLYVIEVKTINNTPQAFVYSKRLTERFWVYMKDIGDYA